MNKDRYIVVRRRFDSESGSDSHEAVFYSDTLRHVDQKIKKHRHYDPGDLLIVCDVAGVSNMIEEAKAVYVVDKSSVVSKPSIIENLWYTNTEDTWIRVWDGEGANV